MTTIAYRDGVMAADAAVFDRDTYYGDAVKIFRSWDGSIGGVAGFLGDSAAFRDWFKSGSQTDLPDFKDETSEGLVVDIHGDVYWVGHGKKRVQVIGKYHAIGSGFQIAMGALAYGASAEDAVRIACGLDAHSRLPITTLRLRGEETAPITSEHVQRAMQNAPESYTCKEPAIRPGPGKICYEDEQ